MAELSLNELRMKALRDHESGVRVAEIVKPDSSYLRSRQRGPEATFDYVARVDRCSITAAKHQVMWTGRSVDSV